MLLLEGVALTDSGRPVLAPEELELRILEKCDFEFGEGKGGLVHAPDERYKAGIAFLTTHRLIWLDAASLPNPGRSCSLQLSRITHSTTVPLKMFGSRTRRQNLKCNANGGGLGPHDKPRDLKLAFRANESPNEFIKCVDDALANKAWRVEESGRSQTARNTTPSFPCGAPPPPPSYPRGQNPTGRTYLGPSSDQQKTVALKAAETSTSHFRRAGVGGALARQNDERQQNEKTLGNAFLDMETLMTSAKELVRLAERFRVATERSNDGDKRENENEKTSSSESTSTSEMREMLISMGITSPVTKETSGALYHKQLSRQLADWLPNVLNINGGVMTLPDVYCLFNRARGNELVSPEDVLRSCQLWESLSINSVMFRRFDSGVLVAHTNDMADDEVCALLASASSAGNRLDAFAASQALGIPPAVAGEYLAMAEGHGILCRDEAPETTWFYPNKFPGFEEVVLVT